MTKAVAAAGIDMKRLQADLDAHDPEITALLKRNAEQAESLGLQGTPVFLVGPYKSRRRSITTGSAKWSRRCGRAPAGERRCDISTHLNLYL